MQSRKLIIFSLMFSLLFPVLGYTFTSFEDEPSHYDISINVDSLIIANILLQDAQSENVTYKGGYVYFTELNDTNVRVNWSTWLGLDDAFQFYKKNILGTWLFGHRLILKSHKTNTWHLTITNTTLIDNWDSDLNWSRFTFTELGWHVFFTYPPTSDNITDAVMNDGVVTVTIGIGIGSTEDVNFRHFLNWYSGMIIGDVSYGLPSFFSWIMRLITAVQLISVVFLTKELFSVV